MNFGITTRLAHFLPQKQPSLIAVIDDGFFSGPSGRLRDVEQYTASLISLGVNGIMGFPGLLEKCLPATAIPPPLIVNLSVSGFIPNSDGRLTPISALRAVQIGATAVTVHASLGVPNDLNMLAALAHAIEDAHQYSIPVFAAIYYRQPSATPNHMTHAARIAVELGADAIKTAYTGDPSSFRSLVRSCSPLPVFVAGGPHESDKDLIHLARGAVEGGAVGFCFGRGLANCSDLPGMISALHDIRC